MTPLFKTSSGDSELASVLNRAKSNIEERTLLDGENYRVERTSRGVRIQIDRSKFAAVGTVEQFQVQSVHRDHLECKRADWNANGTGWTASGEVVRIAKPEAIRMAGWDTTGLGVTGVIDGYTYSYEPGGTDPDPAKNPYIQRVATLKNGSEFGAESVDFTEQVWPKYIEGRTIIYATKVTQSVLTVQEIADEVTSNYDIEWIDLNVDGRTFQPKFRKLRVCVEGQTGPWFVLFRASNSFQEE